MPATFNIPTQTVIPGQLITSALWNGEYQNLYDNFTPAGLDDYSATDGEMQTQTNPFPGSVISRPSSAAGEFERLRFVAAGITGKTYWYQPPTKTIEELNTFDLVHTHTGTTDGTQIPTDGIADGAVTTDKLDDGAVTDAKVTDVAFGKITGTVTPSDGTVTNAKIADVAASKITGQVATTQIADDAITAAKIAADAVGASEIAAGAVGSSELASDAVQTSKIGDGQVTYAKLASDVTDKLSPKSIQRTSGAVTFSSESGLKSANVTITSVDTTKAYIALNGVKVTSGGPDGSYVASARLTSATNVEISVTRTGSGTTSGTFTVYFEVVEWN